MGAFWLAAGPSSVSGLGLAPAIGPAVSALGMVRGRGGGRVKASHPLRLEPHPPLVPSVETLDPGADIVPECEDPAARTAGDVAAIGLRGAGVMAGGGFGDEA